MTLAKVFTATLLLGTLVSVGMLIAFYLSSYSLVPRSLGVYSTLGDDYGSTPEDEDGGRSNGYIKEDEKQDNAKKFSLRQLEQQQQRQQTRKQNIDTRGARNKSKPNLNLWKQTEDDNEETILKKLTQQREPSDAQTKSDPSSKTLTTKSPDASNDIINTTPVSHSQSDHLKPLRKNDTSSLLQSTEKNSLSTTNATRYLSSDSIDTSIEQCKPLNDIVLLKTHKTGSSTLQNILYRYGDTRGLSFVLPSTDVYMGSPAYFHPRYIINTPGGYNILANHARFHKENMAKVMPADTKYISILRYPPKQFESMYSYYSFKGRYHTTFEEFASRAEELYAKYEGKNPRHSGLNPVLYDLGLPKNDLATPGKIDKYIEFVDESFDLIIIAEYLKESLILLTELMCWSMEDIVYFSSNKRDNSLVKDIPKETEKQLLTWHAGDYKLYQYFNRTLHRKIEEYGVQKMKNKLRILDEMIADLADDCLQGTKKVNELHGKTTITRYILNQDAKNKRTCARMTYAAYDYLNMLKKKQKLRRPPPQVKKMSRHR